MFGIGMSELIVILVIALIVLGPKRLPEMAKALGRGLAEFRKATSDLTEELTSARRSIEEEVRNVERQAKQGTAPKPAPPAPPADTVAASEHTPESKPPGP